MTIKICSEYGPWLQHSGTILPGLELEAPPDLPSTATWRCTKPLLYWLKPFVTQSGGALEGGCQLRAAAHTGSIAVPTLLSATDSRD